MRFPVYFKILSFDLEQSQNTQTKAEKDTCLRDKNYTLVTFKSKISVKVPLKRNLSRHNLKILRLKYPIPKFEMPTIKIVDFTSVQDLP